MKETIDAQKLIERFEDMAKRETLLARGNISQQDLLIQIIGTVIVQELEEEKNKDEYEFTTNGWIPIEDHYPNDEEEVQVTYLGFHSNQPHCGSCAYRVDGKWYWEESEEELRVRVIAWKPKDKPYNPYI